MKKIVVYALGKKSEVGAKISKNKEVIRTEANKAKKTNGDLEVIRATDYRDKNVYSYSLKRMMTDAEKADQLTHQLDNDRNDANIKEKVENRKKEIVQKAKDLEAKKANLAESIRATAAREAAAKADRLRRASDKKKVVKKPSKKN